MYTEGLGEERVLQFQTADVKEKGSGQPLEGTFLVLLINYLRAYTAPCNQIYIIACKTFLLACVYMCVCMCGATCEVAVKRFHEKAEERYRKFDRISNSFVVWKFHEILLLFIINFLINYQEKRNFQ